MKFKIFSIKDHALDAYMRPWYAQSTGQAVRMFQDEINNPQSEMHKHPDDYDLYELGDWDEETAEFKNLGTPKQVARGKELVK